MTSGKLLELGGKALEELVMDAEGKVVLDTDKSPFFTSVSHRLQARNQVTLAKMLREAKEDPDLQFAEGNIFEPGSGEGILNAMKWDMLFPITGPRDMISVDLSTEKITRYRNIQDHLSRYWAALHGVKRYELPKTVIADPTDITEMSPRFVYVNKKYHEFPPIAMVWCSSMFHWVRSLDSKIRVMEKFYDMLQPGGILAFNMSTEGTAEEFLEAYKDVMEKKKIGVYHKRNNPQGYKRIKFKEDPIGSMPFGPMKKLIMDSGFTILGSDVKGETALYHNPEEYAESVSIYGRDKFLEPVDHLTSTQQDEVWDMIVKRHREIAERDGWRPGRIYRYEQVNMYVIAKKPWEDVPAEISHASLRKPKLFSIDSVLTDRYLKFALGNFRANSIKKTILLPTVPELELDMSGDIEQIKGKGSTFSLNELMVAILQHVILNWDYSGQDRRFGVAYSLVGNERLTLNIEVATREYTPIERLLKAGMISRLRESEVSMYSRQTDTHRVRYEFNIPIGKIPIKQATDVSPT